LRLRVERLQECKGADVPLNASEQFEQKNVLNNDSELKQEW
jgi:hypothetical protein